MFISVMSTSSHMSENSGIGKADWPSSKSSDVNQPSVRDRKADSLKLHFKLRQTVSLYGGEWPIYVIRY